MFGLFGTKSTAAPEHAENGDKIIPMHFFDDGPLWRAFILSSLFVFDGVLDVERLHISLRTLAHRSAWWKLGARLRQNRHGNLEYHVPSTFTTERPAIAFSHMAYNSIAAEHPVASHIPKPSTRPAVVGNPDDFHDLMKPAGSPMKLGDYLSADIPQLGLHIVSFKDITLVSLNFPHTLMDAMGKHALLNAWSMIVAGRDNEIQDPYGTDFDPLDKLGTITTEPHKLTVQRMGTFGLVGYGLGQVGNFMRQQENRMVCVPQSFVDKLRSQALEELIAIRTQDMGEAPFLTEGDVLCAWWTRMAIAHLPSNSSQTVVLNNAYCIRKCLRPDIIPENASYVSNAVGFINVLIPLRDIVEKPLSNIAASIRHAINELGTRAQIEAFYAMIRESSAKLPPFFGDRNMHMITYSNWTKAKLFEVDFSAALPKKEGNSGKPKYIQNNQFGLTLPNGFPIIGKDNSGNYWLSGYMNKGNWDQISELLAKEA